MFRLFIITFFTLSTLFAQNQNLLDDDFVILTKKEKAFLKKAQIKVISTQAWAPLNMPNEQGELSGIAIDFWELISKQARLKSSYEIAPNWNTVLYKLRQKEADITLATSYTHEKSQYAKFSTPYIDFPIAFATLNNKHFLPDASFLENKKVAVGSNYSAYTILNQAYPQIDFIQVKDTKEALKLLAAGEVYAAVDILPVIAHLISVNGYYNLKIAGTSHENVSISFMIRDDYPELLSIVNKYIQMLTPQEKKDIVKAWLTVKFDQQIVDHTRLIQVSLVILILLLFVLFRQYELKKYNKKLEKLSTTDELTGLFNRRKMSQLLNLEEAKNYSIILLDVDHLKYINDVNSYSTADRILKDLSTILLNNIHTNQYLGRWTGEEFLIFLPKQSLAEAKNMAEHLRVQIETHDFNIGMVTASFGVASNDNNDTINEVLSLADDALREAKREGRNKVVAKA